MQNRKNTTTTMKDDQFTESFAAGVLAAIMAPRNLGMYAIATEAGLLYTPNTTLTTLFSSIGEDEKARVIRLLFLYANRVLQPDVKRVLAAAEREKPREAQPTSLVRLEQLARHYHYVSRIRLAEASTVEWKAAVPDFETLDTIYKTVSGVTWGSFPDPFGDLKQLHYIVTDEDERKRYEHGHELTGSRATFKALQTAEFYRKTITAENHKNGKQEQ